MALPIPRTSEKDRRCLASAPVPGNKPSCGRFRHFQEVDDIR